LWFHPARTVFHVDNHPQQKYQMHLAKEKTSRNMLE
jgi:hypothetical protein